jgi:hypothetical protein
MATPIEEPNQLPGSEVYNQVGERIGTVTQLYGPGGEDPPSWVGVEVRTGMLGSQPVLIPLARLKYEDGQVRVPYDTEHLLDAPGADLEAGPSEEDMQALRDYFAVGRGDQPTEDNPGSYAAQMPAEEGAPQPIDTAD